MAIPARAHFCWIGTALPWAYAFALISAQERGGLDEVVLHHTDALQDGPVLRALSAVERLRISRIDAATILDEVGDCVGAGGKLVDIYRRLEHPAAKTDLLRVVLLYLHGGIYLDLDTLTLRSLLPLLSARQFVGCELIVWPHFVRHSRSPRLFARSLALDIFRKTARYLPEGHRIFKRFAGAYYCGANNAVIGAEKGSGFLTSYLQAITEVPADLQLKKYALGPHLLQQLVQHEWKRDLLVHDPQVFYPLSPEISEHWFRIRRHADLEPAISPRTRLVHWYASVRTAALVAQINPAYVLENQHRQLYSALVCQCVDGLAKYR